MKVGFIGHRRVFGKNVEQRLAEAIKSEAENGCKSFIMGVHGEFDRLALKTCKQIRSIYNDIRIETVITSLGIVTGYDGSTLFDDVDIVKYEVDDLHFKQRITRSNRLMIDECDAVICYVDMSKYRSGAKSTLNYAKKRGLRIINLFREEDLPFYDMTEEQQNEFIHNLIYGDDK